MKCSSCQRDSPDDAAFCAGCGARVALVCGACGRANASDAAFCSGCGQRLLEEETPASAAHTPHPSPVVRAPPAAALPASFAGGRYEVKRFLGEGGRKRVYLAHDARLDRDVAIAVIKTEGLDEGGLERVRREAQAMGRLGDHPHIVTVHDIGEQDPSPGSGQAPQPYIVSQYMEGGDLDSFVRKAENHRLPLDEAVRIANEVRQALEYAHARGIVHRDLKPGNIWLSQDGTAKLGDFGLAVALDRSRLTMEGMMVGTVAYMAPEQALGRAADARSDLYALGCVLYEMVTGRPPFLGDDTVAIVSQHINTAPVAPSWHNPEVPRALEALILRLLAKDPAERPESAAAIPEALNAILESTTTTSARAAAEANPLDRLAGGVFVGREKEMDELRAGLEDALSGRGRLLMLVGEPGIGKTRTSEELATYGRLRNLQVLWGRCYEGEGAPAYWPWVQAIRSYVQDCDPAALLSEMGPGAADIAQVVSEVRERLPGLPAPPALEPEQARFRLFDSITTFLKNAAKGQPLILVLDDLHWADKPSLLMLQFLARELRGARLMVLGTYRDVELKRQHPLAQTLGELNREGLSQRILLRGLSERDVARFIEITSGIAPPESLVDAVYKETEGNPFFVNEIVRLLVADGRLERPDDVKSWSVTIPQGVREVVGRRLDHLSDDCNRVLTIGSVIGREFGLRVLEHVADVSGDRLLEALEEAMAARVITEVPRSADHYSFSHALIRETLYEELSTTRRVRLHRQIGEVLEGIDPEGHLPQLAYHFSEAAPGGDVDKAVDYARRAAERALAQYAYEEAVADYERALQALELKSPPDETQQCGLLIALGDAQLRAGDSEMGQETFLRAADLARKLNSPELLAQAALGMGRVFLVGNLDERSASLLEEALAALSEQDSALRARVTANLAYVTYFTAPREQRLVMTHEAVEMARRIGDKSVLAFTLNARHQSLWELENIEERLEVAAEALRLAQEAGDRDAEASARFYFIFNYLEGGDIPALYTAIAEFSRLAEELRQPGRLWSAALLRATQALLEGRFQDAETLAQQALAAGQRGEAQNAVQMYSVQMFTLRREQGRLPEWEPAMKGFVGQYPLVPAWRTGLAYLYSELGREAEAREQFEVIAAGDFAALPYDANWPIGAALCAQVCAFLGDADRAAVLYERMLPHATRWINVGSAAATIGCFSRYLGLLATTVGRWEDAERHFQYAAEVHAKMGARYWLPWTHYEHADMLLRRDSPGDREKALSLVSQALEAAQPLGMKALIERAVALKLKAQGIESRDLKTSIDAVASAVYVDKPDLRRHAAPDGTVTIMFSDIEGSTAMNERLGDKKWLELLREHNAIVREQVKAHGGYEVKSEGDGFMLAFQSARRALRCAIAVQRAFAERNASLPTHLERPEGAVEGRTEPEPPAHPSRASGRAGGDARATPAEEPMRVRIGLHTGEAIKEGTDFFGRHVNLAARIAGQAKGGEILVSSLLKELTESAGEFTFGEGRSVELKGLAGKHEIWPVERGADGP